MFLTTFIGVAAPSAALADCDPAAFRVGAGMYDITGPVAEVRMLGYAMLHQMTRGLRSRLRSRTFVIESVCSRERVALREKLAAIVDRDRRAAPRRPDGEILEPRRYEEDDARREIRLTERELNALLTTSDPTIGQSMAIDLADDLASVNLLVPLDPNFPILGGKTLRFDIGVELGFAAGKPVVAMRGVSLGGVPIPSAWWGDIKNQNLMEKFGGRGGFWDRFARGVENIQVRDSQLWVQLKE